MAIKQILNLHTSKQTQPVTPKYIGIKYMVLIVTGKNIMAITLYILNACPSVGRNQSVILYVV